MEIPLIFTYLSTPTLIDIYVIRCTTIFDIQSQAAMEDLQKAIANLQVPMKRSPKFSVPKIFKSFKNSVLEDLAMSF